MTKGSPRQELLPLGPSCLREITLPRLARVNRHTIYRRGAMRSTPGHRDDSGEREERREYNKYMPAVDGSSRGSQPRAMERT